MNILKKKIKNYSYTNTILGKFTEPSSLSLAMSSYERKKEQKLETIFKKLPSSYGIELTDWQKNILLKIIRSSYQELYFDVPRQMGKSMVCLIIQEFFHATIVVPTQERRLFLQKALWKLFPTKHLSCFIVDELLHLRGNCSIEEYLLFDEVEVSLEQKKSIIDFYRPRKIVEFKSSVSNVRTLEVENQDLKRTIKKLQQELSVVHSVETKSW